VASEERLLACAALIGRNIERAEDAAHYRLLLDADAGLDEDARAAVTAAGADFYCAALQTWQALDEPDWKQWTAAVKERTGCKGRALFMPLRAALSGALHGPEMSAVVTFLGRDGVTERIRAALAACDGEES